MLARALSFPCRRRDGKNYLAVYDALEQPPTDGDADGLGHGKPGGNPICSSITGCNRIGVAHSADGVTWKDSALVAVQTAGKHPCGQIRTPLGLAPEPERCRGCYSVLWTGITDEKGPSGAFRPICQAVIRNVNE